VSMWSLCITACCINPCGRIVSPYFVHVVASLTIYCSRGRVYRPMLSTLSSVSPMLYQSIVSMWSSVSPYIVSIHSVHVVIVDHNILLTWSLWLTTYRINSYCPCGRVSRHILYQSILSMWSLWLTIYCPCGQSVSPYIVSIHSVHVVIMAHNILPMWSSVSSYIVSIHSVHVVGVAHHILYQFIVST